MDGFRIVGMRSRMGADRRVALCQSSSQSVCSRVQEFPRPAPCRQSRPSVARLTLALLFAPLIYLLLIEAGLPPVAEPVPHVEPVAYVAPAELSIDRSIVTGSAKNLFADAVFDGPDEAEIAERMKPGPSPLEIAATFDVFRNQLRQFKMPALDGDDATGSGPDAAPMAIAAIDHDPMTAALAAIRDAMRTDPFPDAISGALAYARAVAPPSIFDTPVSMRVSEKDFKCLVDAVYFESRSESYRGQVAVAQVVLNRVHSPLYPNSICAVVYQNQTKRNACQFSFACDGIPESVTEPDAWKTAKEVATKVLRGDVYLTEIANATHYHATYVSPDWSRQMKRVTRIGTHIFYRFRWAAS